MNPPVKEDLVKSVPPVESGEIFAKGQKKGALLWERGPVGNQRGRSRPKQADAERAVASIPRVAEVSAKK